ncbi:hypothetical protein [Rhodohalobacter mucosus]|uniref:Polysaccharide deacetylase n=1 Tax=Rhodohalobacter mucosus TaxID=2079485 RepID=A0A316TSC7_9BACT|nr:hypothetical protein [Rhodohalobacter mucosus]PWN07467.1 hypothetical protein DDZ15_04175 [Rhodohalobacter mucosus]
MKLILTFDYELFGDGTGDVFDQMIEPTKAILDVCEQQDIKTTIFFEVLEYLKIKEEWENGNKMGYNKNPVQAIDNQIQRAAVFGHDIQLHLHPQWVGASWQEDSWKLNLENWRLGDFSYPGYTIEKLLKEGKNAIEKLVQKVVPDYQCTILRAGGYNIMPSREVYEAMKNVGLQADSSVYPGGYEHGSLSRYDYREVPLIKGIWWGAREDLRNEGNTKEIMEIPVFALPQRRIHKLFNIDKIKFLIFEKEQNISSVSREKIQKRSLGQKLEFLLGKEAFTWDFCLFSTHLHKAFFRYIEHNLLQERKIFVIIGHPKSYKSDRSLKALISLALERKFSFITLKEAYENFVR